MDQIHHIIKSYQIVRDNAPTVALKNNYFEEKRNPGIGLFFDASRKRVKE